MDRQRPASGAGGVVPARCPTQRTLKKPLLPALAVLQAANGDRGAKIA